MLRCGELLLLKFRAEVAALRPTLAAASLRFKKAGIVATWSVRQEPIPGFCVLAVLANSPLKRSLGRITDGSRMTSCRYLFSPSLKDRLHGFRRSQLGKGTYTRKATKAAVEEALCIAPLAHPHEGLSFLISIPMKRLLLAVGDARQVRASVELLPCRVHLAAKLPFENDAIVRYPLRQVVVDLPDQPVVVADIARNSKQEREQSTGRTADDRNQGIHSSEYPTQPGPLPCIPVDLALTSANAPPR